MNKSNHPGFLLKKNVFESNGLAVGQAAELLGVTRLTISKVINGRGGISANLALRIAAVFGGKADYWLALQREYDLAAELERFIANPPNLTPLQKIN